MQYIDATRMITDLTGTYTQLNEIDQVKRDITEFKLKYLLN